MARNHCGPAFTKFGLYCSWLQFPSHSVGRHCGAPVWYCHSWLSRGCQLSWPSPTDVLRSSRSFLLCLIHWKALSLSWFTASFAERYIIGTLPYCFVCSCASCLALPAEILCWLLPLGVTYYFNSMLIYSKIPYYTILDGTSVRRDNTLQVH